VPDPAPPVARLEGDALAFFDATPRRYATLATINPDGTPHLAVIWYAPLPDGSVLLNSKRGRRWPDNLLRDPRCSLAVEDGMRWVAVRGEVTVAGDREQGVEDICALAHRYDRGDDPAALERSLATFRTQDRVSFHLRPRSVTVHL
jgi:PPOX class probable F420-dependent enzyme